MPPGEGRNEDHAFSSDYGRADDDGGFSDYTPMPKLVGDYQLVSRLGGGSMAELYVARKVSQFGFVHRAVIKQVKRTRPDFRQLQRMLLDEARATACFDHPNLVSIFDVGETEQGLYLALEYVDGTDLRKVNQKLRSRKEALPFELACYIVAEVLRGVHHAHTARGPDGKPLEIVHRDVNPSNVLVASSGHVKLVDFGVVRMRERIQPKTEPGLVKGKYAYLAPEYIAGEPCSVQTDVYAAGIMLFELLSGRECFTGSTAYEVMWKIVNKGVPMYRLQREGVPEDLQRLVARSTSMVPERRYSTAQDMANALEAWLMRSQKHATPWVLSVFFHRHELFQKPVDEPFEPLATPTPAPDNPFDSHGPAPKLPELPSLGPTPESSFGQDRERTPFPQSSPETRDVIDDSLTPTPHIVDGLPLLGVDPTTPLPDSLTPPAPEHDYLSPPAAESPALPFQKTLPANPAAATEAERWGNAPDATDLASATTSTPAGPKIPSFPSYPSLSSRAGKPAASSRVGLGAEPPTQRAAPPSAPPSNPAPTSGFGPAALPPPSADPGNRSVDTSDLAPPTPGSAVPDGIPESSLRNGKLEEHPAADILEQLSGNGASGIIEFRCGLIWKRVLMTGGKPTGVTSNMGMELIGEHLVKARIISREDLEKALQNSERLSKPLTFCLLEQGALTRETLEIELGRNLAARLQEVLEWRWGTYEFNAQAMEPVEILPKLDLPGLLATARANRAEQDAAAKAPGAPEPGDDTPQTKLKEALRVARSIAKSTGKGRVDRLWRNSKP